MGWTRVRGRVFLGVVAMAVCFGGSAAAQSRSPAHEWFEDTYRRMDVEVAPADVERLAGLWDLATDGSRTESDRQVAFRDLLDTMIQVQRVPEWRYTESALQGMVDRVGELKGMAAPPPLLPVEPGDWGEPGRVEVVGEGPIPLVLVSDLDYGGSVYRDFAEAHGDRFTSTIVTLPGAEGTPPPPLEGPVTATPWLENAEQVVLSVIESRGLTDPVIVGVMGGVYTAARLALEHPERFRAAVLLHGLVSAPRLSPTDPTRFATTEERVDAAAATLPPLFPPDLQASAAGYRSSSGGAAIDSTTARELTDRAARTHPAVLGRYVAELGVTDLHDAFVRLEVPTLVVPSVHDPRSPVPNTEMGTGQWTSLALDYPDIPLTVVPFHATRNYAPVDHPDVLAWTLESFLAGERPRGLPAEPTLSAFRASPAAETMQVLGATQIRIGYSAPGVKGRQVWGGLVPWDRLWRAGANAATWIEFSEDVLVESEPLEAGRYSFFLIPRENDPWTLVFNRVDIQMGSFFYETRHDALRVDVPPEPAAHTEWLEYRIEPQPPEEGRVVLRWADREVAFEVVAREDTGLDRIAATSTERLEALEWTELGTDPADGSSPQRPDARAVSWAVAGDTAWFRIQLHGPANPAGVGVNLVLDTDLDQSTGGAWWGGSTGFTYDRVATLWVTASADDFWGTIGVSDPAAAAAGDYRSLGRENLAFAMSSDARTLYAGAPVAALDDDGRVRLIVAVGTNVFWNDNLLDDAPPELELRP